MKQYLCLLCLVITSYAYADTPGDLLKASDRFRGGLSEGITWTVRIDSVENGRASDRTFNVRAKGDDAHVSATSPARNQGEVYLLKNRDMWFYKPTLKKPVAVSSRQKLVGQAANGDIASTHYSRDYTPTLEKEEKIAGEDCAVLLLKAKSPEVTYDQIRYWIQKKTKLAVKAEFLTLQGKVFKIGTMKYENSIHTKSGLLPFVSSLSIVDAKYPENKSVLYYKRPRIKDQPASLFSVNELTR